ncbi:MAG: hypothetical protein NTY09_04190 [bacterium]|nr:hypothetical protein [bacterium]
MEEVETGFLKRLNPVIAGLTLLTSVCSLAFWGLNFAIAVLAGGAFAIFNTNLIAGLIQVTLADVRKPRDIIVAFCIKFPLVYGVLVLLFSRRLIDLIGFTVGFTMLLAGLIAFAIIDNRTHNHAPTGSSREDNIQ